MAVGFFANAFDIEANEVPHPPCRETGRSRHLPATADKLLQTSLDILRGAMRRGVTGKLFRASRHMPSREIYVMQGQILAAHGPDDGPWANLSFVSNRCSRIDMSGRMDTRARVPE